MPTARLRAVCDASASAQPAFFFGGGWVRVEGFGCRVRACRAGFRVSGFGGLVSLGLRVFRVSASGSEFGVLGL